MGKGRVVRKWSWEGETRRPRYSHHCRVSVKGGGGDLVWVVVSEGSAMILGVGLLSEEVFGCFRCSEDHVTHTTVA